MPTGPHRSATPRGELCVLVLAAGGSVSQGILKALGAGSLRCRPLAACISPLAAGLHGSEPAFLSPLAAEPEFEPWLVELCRRERVDAVTAGNEIVLDRLAELAPALRAETGTIALVAPPDRLAVARDKLATCRWLERSGLPHPRFADAADDAAVERLLAGCGFPLWAKPRTTSGSRGGFRVDAAVDLAAVRRRPGYLLQEYLGDAGEEYSAGCVSDRHGRLRGTIVLRRRLDFGLTVTAEAGEFAAAREVAGAVASALAAPGPCNVQMRRHQGRFVPFEVNLRFSSTTPMRVAFGFPEVDATLRHLVLGEPMPPLPEIARGVAVRYWEERYLDPARIERLAADGELDGAPPAGRPLAS